MADSDILCAICHDGNSVVPNEIVICDVCNQGYHQLCHKPNIEADVLLPEVEWNCRNCIFALATKEGGAVKDGSIGEQFRKMKTELSYDMNSLTWDKEHQTNLERRYCYCGGQGEYYKKMLQCEKCLQWFHEGCIQELETPLLYGDHYYTFNCAICNRGIESVKRIIMRWSDVVALILYNLSLQFVEKKYFDLYDDIIPFFKQNSYRLKLSEDVNNLDQTALEEKLIVILCNNKDKFIEKLDRKKQKVTWTLRDDQPLIFAPPFALSNSPKKIISPNLSPSNDSGLPSSSSSTTSSFKMDQEVPTGACRKNAFNPWPLQNEKKNQKKQSNKKPKIQRTNSFSSNAASATSSCASKKPKRLVNNKTSPKLPNVNKIRSVKTNLNNRFKPPSSTNSEISEDSETISISMIDSLESVIPIPRSFDGDNNPFLDEQKNMFKRLTNDIIRSDDNDNDQHISNANLSSNNLIPKSHNSISLSYLDSNEINEKHEKPFKIVGRRVKPDGSKECLVEWN